MNLIGEHVDYLGGRCIPIAIPYASWVAWAPRDDDRLVLTSSAAAPVHAGRGDVLDGWGRYVLGALDESTWSGGVDLHVESTVPLGAGLSSSAALTCAVLRAVDDRAAVDLVEPAIRAETVRVGVPTGGLDQTASLLSTVGHALVVDFAGRRPVQLPWHPQAVGLELLVIDTGVRHANDDGAFARVRSASEEAMAAVDDDVAALPPTLAAHRRHVTSELARVEEVVDALVRGDWRGVGTAFTASHVSLRDDLGVSCPELDAVVDSALEAGALGARMTGGGFGGCALVLSPVEQRDAVIAAVRHAFAQSGWDEPTVLLGDAEGPATRVG